jgi:hypothetical protein
MKHWTKTLIACASVLVLAAALVACGSDDPASEGNGTATTICAERSTSQPQTGTSDTSPEGGSSQTTPSGNGAGTSTTSPAAQSRSGVAGNVAGESAEEEPSTTPSSGATTPSSTGTGTTGTTVRGSESVDCSEYSTTDDGGTGTGG